MADNNLESKTSFLIIKGKFDYSNVDDQVIFMAIIGEERVQSWNLAITSNQELQMMSLDIDYVLFKRGFEQISPKERNRSYDLKTKLGRIVEVECNNLLEATEAEIKELFKSNLEEMIKEEVELNLVVEEVSKQNLIDNLPNLLQQETNLSEQERESSTAEIIEINCSPVVKPIGGKKINKFQPGDKVLVEVPAADYEQIADNIPKSIKKDNNKLQGTVQEINFNSENNIYRFAIQLTTTIDGKLVLEANPDTKLAIPQEEIEIDLTKLKKYEPIYNKLIYILTIILVIGILLLLLLEFY